MAEEFRRASKTHLADCLLLFVLPIWPALHLHPADPVCVTALPLCAVRTLLLSSLYRETEENQSRD